MSILGGSLGDVTSSLNNLAAVFVQLNDLRAAEVLYRKTVRIREHQYGHSHPTVARSIEMLANMLSELGTKAPTPCTLHPAPCTLNPAP
jgi:hypothetical protein